MSSHNSIDEKGNYHWRSTFFSRGIGQSRWGVRGDKTQNNKRSSLIARDLF